MATWIAIYEKRGRNIDFKIKQVAIIICIQFFLYCPKILVGQSQSYTIHIEKGTLYADLFEELQNKFNIHISYPSEIGHFKTIESLTIKGPEPDPVLKKILFSLHLDFLFLHNKDVLVRALPEDINDQWLWIQFEISEKNGTPAPFILVHTNNLEEAEYTDASGWCGLKLKKMKFNGEIHLYSFNFIPQTLVLEKKNQLIHVVVELQPNKLPTVILSGKQKNYFFIDEKGNIKYQNDHRKSSGIQVFGNDPVKQVQILAGIQAHDDKNSAIKIRGGSEEATLLLIDKTPVYKIDHLLGVFSAVNGDYFKDWELYKNYIPVEYGGKTGGMLDIKSREDNSYLSGSVNVNFLFTSLVAKISPNRNFGLQAGIRKSFNSNLTTSLTDFSSRNTLLNSLPDNRRNRSIIVNQPNFGFYDFQCKSWLILSSRHSLHLNGFLSNDQMNNKYVTSFRGPAILYNEQQIQNKRWNNAAGSAIHVYKGKIYSMESQIYLTRFEENADLQYNISRINLNNRRFDTLSNNNENYIFDTGLKWIFSKNNNQSFRFGTEWIQHRNILFFEESETPLFEVNRTESVLSLFTTKSWKLHPRFQLKTNVRGSYVQGLRNFWLLPQFALEYQHSSWNWQLGISRYKQAVRMLEFENFFGQRSTFFVLANNTSIPVLESYNSYSLVSYQYKSVSFLTEAYYRKTNGNLFLSKNIASLLDRNIPNSPTDYTLFNGNGRYYGIDLGVFIDWKNWAQSYQYSLSKSENRFSNLFDYQYINAVDDSRHQLKMLQSYKWKHWNLQTSFIYASGRPYTNVNQILAERENINLIDIERDIYQDRLPDYIRWDAAINYKFEFKQRTTLTIELSCFNVANRANVKYRQFYFQLPNNNAPNLLLGNDVIQLGRTYNLGATFTFH